MDKRKFSADSDAGQAKHHSRLLIDEEPLQVLPTLAVAVGINEAILLQQTHYWLKIAEKANDPRKFFGGRWWTYNTYADWQRQMPWLKERTVRALVAKLEEIGVLLSVKRNAKRRDHTKWYSVDYEALEALYEEQPEGKNDTSDVAENDTLNPDSNVAENDTSMWQKMTHPDVAENDTSYTESPKSLTENLLPSSGDEVDVDKVKERERTSKGKIRGLTNDEAQALIDDALDGDPLKDRVMSLVRLAASQNKSTEIALSRAYNEFVEPYAQGRQNLGLSEEAWQHGFTVALGKGVANIGYVKTSARNYWARGDTSVGHNTAQEQELGSGDEGKRRRMEGYEWLFGEEAV